MKKDPILMTAEELGLTYKEVQTVVYQFWANIRKLIKKKDRPVILLNNFATFYVNPYKIKAFLNKYPDYPEKEELLKLKEKADKFHDSKSRI
jgi:nucleoid DNA-binding protein